MLVAAMACVGIAVTILVFYPGYLTEDATYIYGYVQQRYLGDWQSPVMTIVWSLIDPISPGSGSMFLLNAVLYWSAFGAIALAVARVSAPLALAVLLLAFVPPAFMLLVMIWRDVLFAVVWLFAAAITYLVADRAPPWRSAVQGFALALIALGVLVRPNAIIAAPLLVAYVLWPARFAWKRTALLFIPAVIAGYVLIQIVYYGVLGVHRQNPLHSLLVFDLGGITYFTQQNQFPVSWTADETALLITQCYDPARWDGYWTLDPCKFVMDRLEREDDVIFGTPRLTQSWLRAIATHPLAYLSHRLSVLWTFLAGANPTLDLDNIELPDQVPLAAQSLFHADRGAARRIEIDHPVSRRSMARVCSRGLRGGVARTPDIIRSVRRRRHELGNCVPAVIRRFWGRSRFSLCLLVRARRPCRSRSCAAGPSE